MSSDRPLSPKDRIYVDSMLSGMTQIASAAAAGCLTPRVDGSKMFKKENIQAALTKRMDKLSSEVNFGRKEAHDMLMQAFRNADTAMEQITAVRELIKLHGIAAPVKVEHEHTHTHELQLEHMPLKELMKLANQNSLTLEGEFERVADRKPVLLEDIKEDAKGSTEISS